MEVLHAVLDNLRFLVILESWSGKLCALDLAAVELFSPWMVSIFSYEQFSGFSVSRLC